MTYLREYPIMVDMSDADSEGTTTDADSDAGSVATTFTTVVARAADIAEVEADLEQLTTTIELLCNEIANIEEHLKTMERPVANIALEQFGDIMFLESSPFRNHTFAIKPPGFASIDITKRYAYKDIVKTLREYLFYANLVQADGTIKVTRTLGKLFEIKETETTFLTLLRHLRYVLI